MSSLLGREVQPSKALSSTVVGLEPDSNVTVLRLLQSKKQCLLMIATLDGIQMDDRELQPLKTLFSNVVILAPGSNATVLRLLQVTKQ
jgi:hypothetical protein